MKYLTKQIKAKLKTLTDERLDKVYLSTNILLEELESSDPDKLTEENEEAIVYLTHLSTLICLEKVNRNLILEEKSKR